MVGPNKLSVQPWSALTDADRAFLREHREAIKELVRAGLPPLPVAPKPAPAPEPTPAPVSEPEPVLYACGIRITESHVRTALKGYHDGALGDYLSGRTSKWEAYRLAQNWVRQVMEFGGRP